MATYYIDATGGSDSNDGLTEDTAWATVDKVNATTFSAGDSILFKRGETFRAPAALVVTSDGTEPEAGIVPGSGSASGGVITYGAYGLGEKPKILGSRDYSSDSLWTEESTNIWVAGDGTVTGSELIANPSFDTDATGWTLYTEDTGSCSGVRDTSDFDSTPASIRLDCTTAGADKFDIQLFFNGTPMSITEDNYYKLTFRVKGESEWTIPQVDINSSASPFLSYMGFNTPTTVDVTTSYATYTLLFQANRDGTDAILSLRLGGTFPDGESLWLDTFSLKEADPDTIFRHDIGLLVFDNESSTGTKISAEADLNAQNEFWYDKDNWRIKMYSTSNPGTRYSQIELAQTYSGLAMQGKKYITIQDLDFRYFGAHGIAVGNCSNITVSGCEVHFGGGGDLIYALETQNVDPAFLALLPSFLRFGNGIEFEGSCSDSVIEKNVLYDIYDTGLSNQSVTSGTVQSNLVYKNNIIKNCHYSFEIWVFATNATMSDVSFVHNLCLNAGGTFGEDQRTDADANPACHIAGVLPNLATTTNVKIQNNIFYGWITQAIWFVGTGSQGAGSFDIDYNCYYDPTGFKAKTGRPSDNSEVYYTTIPSWYAASGDDLHSIADDPQFINASLEDYHLTPGSQCQDRGADLGVTTDYENTPRVGPPDLGPFEINGLSLWRGMAGDTFVKTRQDATTWTTVT